MADDDDQQGVFTRDAAEEKQHRAGDILILAAAAAAGTSIRATELVAVADRFGDVRLPIHQSSCISNLGYNLTNGDMEVSFHDGSVYYYPGVRIYDFLQFLNARSKGSHYNRFWRGKEELIQGKKKGSHIKP